MPWTVLRPDDFRLLPFGQIDSSFPEKDLSVSPFSFSPYLGGYYVGEAPEASFSL